MSAARLLMASITVVAGCTPGRPLAPVPAVAEIVMVDYGFEVDTDIPSGRVVFEMRNVGRKSHNTVVVALPPDFPPLAEQLASDERRTVATIAHSPDLEPGGRGVFAVELRPGRYGLLCFVEAPNGRQHARMGMRAEFSVATPRS